jgi:IstB-like ATP binding protein
VADELATAGSVILTSNRGFGDWGQVFADPVVAAIVDRLPRQRRRP